MKAKRLGRRKFLKATAAGAAAASVAGFPYIAKAADRRIVVTAGGGAYGKAHWCSDSGVIVQETRT